MGGAIHPTLLFDVLALAVLLSCVETSEMAYSSSFETELVVDACRCQMSKRFERRKRMKKVLWEYLPLYIVRHQTRNGEQGIGDRGL